MIEFRVNSSTRFSSGRTFITGADALAQILSWKRADELFELAHLVEATRPGFHLGDEHLSGRAVSLVEVPAMAISSTDCRERVARRLPVWYLVPDGVVQYIKKWNLYRETELGRAHHVADGGG